MSPQLTIQNHKQRLVAAVDRLMPEAWAFARQLFDLKELSGKEHESARLLTERLRAAGATVEMGIGGLPTAFRATCGSGSPRVALLAEYDALPDLGHACGHHLSGVASVFAAIALAECGIIASPSRSPSPTIGEGEKYGGILEVIGTPMEESLGGKIRMINAGVFRDVDVALMTHTSNETRAAYRTVASQAFRITLTAAQKDYHWRKQNITDVLVDVLLVLWTVEDRAGVGTQIMWAIPEGGTQNNVVPPRIVVDCSVWSYEKRALDRTIERIRFGCEHTAKATDVTVAFDMYEPCYLPFDPNDSLVGLFERNLKFLGTPFEPRQGRLFDSIDTGNVNQILPTLHADIFLDASRTHTPEHAAAGATAAGEQYLRTSATALALTALDLLRDPKDVERAKRAFGRRGQPRELQPDRLP